PESTLQELLLLNCFLDRLVTFEEPLTQGLLEIPRSTILAHIFVASIFHIHSYLAIFLIDTLCNPSSQITKNIE
ncbi:hypothetical protein ACJX0J_027669, partial [Zea mays]